MLIPPPSTPWSGKDFHLADWTVVVNERKAFQVNSTALASNSRYFYDAFAALKDGAAAKLAQPLRVTRLDYPDLEAVQDLLDFIARVASAHEAPTNTDLAEPLSIGQLKSRLKAARHFGVPRLLDCVVSTVRRNLAPRTCWDVMAMAAEPDFGCSLLEEVAMVYARHHFCEAAEEPAFATCVSFEQLRQLLHSDYLAVPEEFQLFDIICRWVEADESTRLGHFPLLLSHMRLGRLTGPQIDRIAANRLAHRTSAETTAVLTCALQGNINPSHFMAMQQSDPPIIREMLLPRLPHQAIFLCGGWEGNIQEASIAPSSAVQLFDALSGAWVRHDTFLPTMDTRHAYSACVELDCVVYLIGGYVQLKATSADLADVQGPTVRVRAYFLRRNVWRERAPMHEARNFVSACSCGGRLYALGGHNGHQRLASAEAYCPRENRWTPVASMMNIRSDASAASLKGLVYICGGFSGTRFLATAERYDPASDQWTMLAQLTTGRSGLSVSAFGKYIYAMGGNSGTQRLASVERYDPDANSWTEVAPMLTQRSNFCSCVLSSCLYAIGGWSDQTRATVPSVERCRLDAAWEPAIRLGLPNSACSCCVISDCYLIEPLLSPERHALQPIAEL